MTPSGEVSGPLVTVVVPCRDDYGWIGGALESVASQSWARWELIVVDDGSERIPGWFRSDWAGRDRVRLIRRSGDGVSAARNAGIEAAAGEYVAFLDADDRWRPTKLEASLAPLERDDEETVLVYTAFVTERPATGERRRRRPSSFPAERFLRAFYVSGQGILPSTAVVRTRTIRAVGGFDEGLPVAEDRDCWLRLARRGRVAFVDEPLTVKTLREEGLGAAGAYWRRYRWEKRVARKLAAACPALEGLLPARRARIRSSGGFRLLEAGRWRRASVFFRAALADDPRCRPAWAGLALTPAVAVLGGRVARWAREARRRWRTSRSGAFGGPDG